MFCRNYYVILLNLIYVGYVYILDKTKKFLLNYSYFCFGTRPTFYWDTVYKKIKVYTDNY